MAAQGCCRNCDAAFIHPPIKGYAPCPFCGTTLERTSKLYTGAWFSVDGAASPYALRFTVEPLPDIADPRTRAAFVAYIKAKQNATAAAWVVAWAEGQRDNPYYVATPEQYADRLAHFQRQSDSANAAQERAYNVWQSVATNRPNPDDYADPTDYAEAAEYARLGL